MLNEIKTYLQFGNLYCGIEQTSMNGQDKLYAILLKKTKKEVDIENFFNNTTIEVLTKQLPKNGHAVLIINNESVLTKTIESDITDALKLVHKAFPNISLEDFYYEVLIQESIHFVSICRKAYVEDLIKEYSTKGVSIINVSLGNTIAYSICEFINSDTISTSNTRLTIKDNGITDIEKVNDIHKIDYDFNGVKVSSEQLLSFSGALDSIIKSYMPHTNFESYKILLLNNYKQSRFFRQFLKIGLIFILGLVLTNFLIFNHYYNAVNELQQTSQINQTTKNKVLLLNETVSKTQKMVDDMLKSSASKSSFYVNAIIQSLPITILLKELNYQPLIKRIKAEQPIHNEINTILISGRSSSSEAFSKWFASLESIDWIDNVEILSYGDISKSKSDFSIKLDITDD